MITLSVLLSDPILFFKAITGHEPSEFQRYILTCDLRDGKRLAALISRKQGKSTVIAIRLLYEALVTREKSFVAILLGPSLDQATIIYRICRDALRSIPALVALCQAWEQKHRRKLADSAEELEVPQRGGRGVSIIRCMSGDQTRGLAKYLVGPIASILCVDESSLLPEGTYTKVRECVRTGPYRTIIAIGTPRAETGWFFKACRPVKDTWQYNSTYTSRTGWTVIHRDWQHCPHLFDDPTIKAEIERDMIDMDDMDIQQELFAHFVSGSGKFFTHQDVNGCIAPVMPWSEYVSDHQIILTIDEGLEEDPAVAIWFAASGHHHLTIIHIEAFRRDPPERSGIIAVTSKADIVKHCALLSQKRLKPIRTYIDATHDSSFPILFQDAGFSRVEGVYWSAKEKTDLMFSLRDALRAQQYSIPKEGHHGRTLVSQLLQYNYTVSEVGNYIFNQREDTARRRKVFADDFLSSMSMSTKWLQENVIVKPIARVGKKSKKWDCLRISSEEREALVSLN